MRKEHKTYEELMQDLEQELRVCARLAKAGHLKDPKGVQDTFDRIQRDMCKVAYDRAIQLIKEQDADKYLAEREEE